MTDDLPRSPQLSENHTSELRAALRRELKPLIEDANAPDSEVEQVVSSVITLVSEKFRGPIPHPKHFKEYEAILPGAADRILTMTEVTVQHNIEAARRELGLAERDAELAKVEVIGEQKYQNLGLVLGFMALLAMIAGAIWLGLAGQPVLAGAFLATGAIGVVGRFIQGRNKTPEKVPD